jgi:hypothetical protein
MVERRTAERRLGLERRKYTTWLAFIGQKLDLFTGSGSDRPVHVPLWALLIIISLSFLYLMVNFGSSQPTASMMQNPYQTGEVIVFDASEQVTSEIIRSGYAIVEVMDLGGLNIKVHLLKIPLEMSITEALNDLQNRYPGLEVNANDQVISSDPS